MRSSESNPQKSRLLGNSSLTAWPPVLGFLVADACLEPLFANDVDGYAMVMLNVERKL